MKTMMQYFEWYLDKDDHLWQKLSDQAKYLKDLGVDYVWLPPAYKGHKGDKDSGYGVYDLYDLGEFAQKGSVATKYGDVNAYLEALASLKSHDIKVVSDIVLNHRMGADEKEQVAVAVMNPYNRHEELAEKTIEAWTKFNFPGRNNHYSSFKWNHRHFKGIDFDDREKSNHEVYLFKGKKWDDNVDLELANYDYLMGADVDVLDPEVFQELTHWGRWYLAKTQSDGFRLDAIKHISFGFFTRWLKALEVADDFFVVGEYWSHDLRALHNYLMEENFSFSLFDVPLHYNLYKASKNPYRYDLRTIFNNTLVLNQPKHAVTFVDNHDTQIGQALESWVASWFKPHAYALILLRNQGIPTVFYGDLYGSKHHQMKPVAGLEVMMKLRKALDLSTIFDYFDDPECIGWSVIGEKGFALLMSNGNKRLKKMHVGLTQAQKTYVNVLDLEDEQIVIDEKGNGIFPVNEKSLAIYMEVEAYNEILL